MHSEGTLLSPLLGDYIQADVKLHIALNEILRLFDLSATCHMPVFTFYFLLLLPKAGYELSYLVPRTYIIRAEVLRFEV